MSKYKVGAYIRLSKEVFDKVQEMLKVQRRSTNKNDLLSGYLFCADCGGIMTLFK